MSWPWPSSSHGRCGRLPGSDRARAGSSSLPVDVFSVLKVAPVEDLGVRIERVDQSHPPPNPDAPLALERPLQRLAVQWVFSNRLDDGVDLLLHLLAKALVRLEGDVRCLDRV